MHRLLTLLLLTLVLAAVGCSPAGRPPEISRQAPAVAEETVAQAEAPPAAAKTGSAPAPVLVLVGLAVGAALMVALISHTAMMPDTAP